ILGGLGFLVLHECRDYVLSRIKGTKHRLSLHTRMVLSLTLALILFSFIVFLVVEWHFSLEGYGPGEKILTALFQVVTPRTAGFNTINLNAVGTATTGLLIFLMFVGASPGSTGGGIKTSTIGVLLAFIGSKLNARESVHAFRRTLPTSLVMKAFTVLMLSVVVIFISAFLLLSVEPELSMRSVFFEVFSAFGTVGLSMGLTPQLGTAGKIILIVTMYVGRIGPLALLYAFSRRRPYGKYEYVEESVMIG
ncbi:MAG: potassium transporter TrkG, partial [Acidobacteriota bacterium]